MADYSDEMLLSDMERALMSFGTGSVAVGDLALQLLTMRDAFTKRDVAWSRAVTQHIATLDSASSFKPVNEADAKTAQDAVADAVKELSRLIRARISA